ncbi:ribonuclease P protein component [Frankia sp. CNm7]|nr:ribonuclease P protein component [Frankia nepalensis]MBL7496741.1 ribonuclease P protein component [Frankia nepalensis]MBL7510437.1 ribonuclease P protein component [Frankia nepalensis]MBL7523494.1 ribonuclease P protein component [Frankia nepalensis]
MLPARSRVSSREEHARVGRRGRRFTCPPLVVHALSTDEPGPARAGFVVSRKVGTAVTRNRVRRRLREQARSRLASVPPGTLLVIRALPAAADASSAELGRALDRGFGALHAANARRRPSADARPAGPRPRATVSPPTDDGGPTAKPVEPGDTATEADVTASPAAPWPPPRAVLGASTDPDQPGRSRR